MLSLVTADDPGVSAAEKATRKAAPVKVAPKQLERAAIQQTQQQEEQESGPSGGTGVYVLDGVDFHPVGGGEIPGLGWNNKIPFSSYYEFHENSYIIVTGAVHGDGLISGPGQDDWTFVVKLDMNDVIGPRPAGCQFSVQNRPQTDSASTAWKYQLLIVFADTASKPECFQYFQSLENKPFPVKLVDIVGPYWTGDKQYLEPKTRQYKTGPMLPLSTNVSSGHVAEPW